MRSMSTREASLSRPHQPLALGTTVKFEIRIASEQAVITGAGLLVGSTAWGASHDHAALQFHGVFTWILESCRGPELGGASCVAACRLAPFEGGPRRAARVGRRGRRFAGSKPLRAPSAATGCTQVRSALGSPSGSQRYPKGVATAAAPSASPVRRAGRCAPRTPRAHGTDGTEGTHHVLAPRAADDFGRSRARAADAPDAAATSRDRRSQRCRAGVASRSTRDRNNPGCVPAERCAESVDLRTGHPRAGEAPGSTAHGRRECAPVHAPGDRTRARGACGRRGHARPAAAPYAPGSPRARCPGRGCAPCPGATDARSHRDADVAAEARGCVDCGGARACAGVTACVSARACAHVRACVRAPTSSPFPGSDRCRLRRDAHRGRGRRRGEPTR